MGLQVGWYRDSRSPEVDLNNLDSERAWCKDFGQYLKFRDRYFRLSPGCKAKLPEQDDLQAFENGMLESLADGYLGEASLLIENIAQRLLATSFYFEPDEPWEETEDGRRFRG